MNMWESTRYRAMDNFISRFYICHAFNVIIMRGGRESVGPRTEGVDWCIASKNYLCFDVIESSWSLQD